MTEAILQEFYKKGMIMSKLQEIFDKNKPHLGGNASVINSHTYCPSSWKYVIDRYNIKSVLDVGSGFGFHAKWFFDQGINTLAIEGLQYNVDNGVYPMECVDLTEKHFTADVDLVNCIEVVEHIEEKYLPNLLTTLCCGKYIFMTHGQPGQRGHHHVNNQPTDYWIKHLKTRGFKLLKDDSDAIKQLAVKDGATHIQETGMLFVKE